MKKYLLLATNSTYEEDDEHLAVNTTQVGSYDTTDQAIEAAKTDLRSVCEELAECYYDKEEPKEFNKFINNYLENVKVNDIDSLFLARVGADRIALEHEYQGRGWQDKNVYTVIKVN